MDVVILETVGVGQADVDVVSATHTVAVVSVPGMGDDIQAIKAGLLEVADVHVVNKSDYRGAQKTVAQLRDMLRLRHRRSGQWNVPVAQTVAETGAGVADLVAEFARHRDWLERTGEIESRDRRNASERIRWAAQDLLADQIRRRGAEFDDAVSRVAQRQLDPHAAAAAFICTTRHSRAGRCGG
jgi:LAO/AO transport system kinase